MSEIVQFWSKLNILWSKLAKIDIFLNSGDHVKRAELDIPCLLCNCYIAENKIINATTSENVTFVVKAYLCFIL